MLIFKIYTQISDLFRLASWVYILQFCLFQHLEVKILKWFYIKWQFREELSELWDFKLAIIRKPKLWGKNILFLWLNFIHVIADCFFTQDTTYTPTPYTHPSFSSIPLHYISQLILRRKFKMHFNTPLQSLAVISLCVFIWAPYTDRSRLCIFWPNSISCKTTFVS